MLLNINSNYNILNVNHCIPDNLIFKNSIKMTDSKLLENMYITLKYTLQFLKNNNIKYIAIGGTLIGATRHTGFIPWDNDFDLLVFKEDYFRLKKLTSKFNTTNIKIINIAPGFKIFFDNIILGDIFVYDLKDENTYKKSYPYIQKTPTFLVGSIFFPWIEFNKNDLLPSKTSNFEDFEINIPNNPDKILKVNYPTSNLKECIYFDQEIHTMYPYVLIYYLSCIENFFTKIPYIGIQIIKLCYSLLNLYLKKLWLKA